MVEGVYFVSNTKADKSSGKTKTKTKPRTTNKKVPESAKFSFAPSKTAEREEPYVFSVNGTVVRAYPSLPGWALLELAAAVNDGGDNSAAAFRDLIARSVLKEDYDLFVEAMTDPVTSPDVQGIIEIASWLLEQYTGHPTGPSSES
jgi:hypothetical protein